MRFLISQAEMLAFGDAKIPSAIAPIIPPFNRRIVGDLKGKKTCFQYNGSSVVDYVVGSKSILTKECAISYC